MTPCEELGYKVGDEFIIQEDGCGFVEGQTVKLYKDDGRGYDVKMQCETHPKIV